MPEIHWVMRERILLRRCRITCSVVILITSAQIRRYYFHVVLNVTVPMCPNHLFSGIPYMQVLHLPKVICRALIS